MGLMVQMHSVFVVFIVSMNISLYHDFNDLSNRFDHNFTDLSNRLTMVSMIYLNGFITVLLVYLIMILLIYPTGLIIVQMLVKSDKRIEQVFNHYGGTRLLMAMVKFTTGELRKQVTSTLKSVTHGKSKGNIL